MASLLPSIPFPLIIPFPDKEQTVKPVSKTEQACALKGVSCHNELFVARKMVLKDDCMLARGQQGYKINKAVQGPMTLTGGGAGCIS
ncbi:hypothetical protein NC651_029432 [Populus alba x Populus x berolinensis]|nr:hypothetical protein NC651_029432 [Populus alba x Populus x berolinensis]